MALLLGQATAGLIWFALPRFKEGTFGGIFTFSPESFPATPGSAPVSQPEGRFHIVHTEDDGVLTLYGVCTHLGCLPKWENDRFACPCHGSQFTLEGNYITGPAPRGLDLFRTIVTFDDGTVEETVAADSRDGKDYAIKLNGRQIVKIEVDTGARIRRPGHA
ncbi:MAG: Rieske 2Fe-2S domain-containing protein [Chloroflexota bacterium]